ncbi:MAG: sulfatase-like hydrolase/transferase [Planctomycetes bacterium]|nr:sulfatase-like hydrolase/transferase [Planctomycetota bacterium]
MQQPNVLFLLIDQLRAASLSLYGETRLETPHIDRLASQSLSLTNMISTCPVCTPYRAMLLTGRHPQSTSYVINSLRPHHGEISLGDAFSRAGYRTGWVGKWHLHTGGWPANDVPDWVPKGRSRLGFDYWRAYNQHMVYFDGFINSSTEDWSYEQWEGYETEALNRYAFSFLDEVGNDPFCLFISPQPPHWTGGQWAPEHYYDRLPGTLPPPKNVPSENLHAWEKHARDYAAMILAVDEMVGEVMDYLDRTGKAEKTILVLTSDHGTMGAAQGEGFWAKKLPYEESLKVPFIIRMPGIKAGTNSDVLTAPVDLMPTLCSLCKVPIPQPVEGHDLSDAWLGKQDAFEQDSLFTMNFGATHDLFRDGNEWRGVRTKTHSYARWLDGKVVLYDLVADPLQQNNLADDPKHADLLKEMEQRLIAFQRERGDNLQPCTDYMAWFDEFRRPIRNGYGERPHPETDPDWNKLVPIDFCSKS